MRTRNIKKQVWLNREEATLLKKKAKKVCTNESELIRRLITDSVIKEKPDDRFYDTMKELRAIGNNLNQIARRLNYDGTFNDTLYKNAVNKLNNFIINIKNNYL